MRALFASPFLSRWALLGVLLSLLASCTDPYLPEAVSAPPSYLVVDGFLNPQGVTSIRLTRTYAIASTTAPPAETRATLYVEEEGGPRYPLREGVGGNYASTATLLLNSAKRYRLHIRTLAGKEYASDYVPVKITPPIDAVTWRVNNGNLNIYVSAHDATNATQFYRWDYAETWEIRPLYSPSVEYVNGGIRDILVRYPSVCWGNEPGSNVQIDKTTSLTQDVVSDHRLRVFPTTSERLYSRYSIMVQQYALTKEEYAYWDLLRKNTESIGTLFDPQPAQLTGNIHCLSNPGDVSLGFISAHTVTDKRIFISRSELRSDLNVRSGYEKCIPPDTVFLKPKGVLPPPTPAEVLFAAFNDPKRYLPIYPIYIDGFLGGYLAKTPDCIDCRLRGTAVKPSYWP